GRSFGAGFSAAAGEGVGVGAPSSWLLIGAGGALFGKPLGFLGCGASGTPCWDWDWLLFGAGPSGRFCCAKLGKAQTIKAQIKLLHPRINLDIKSPPATLRTFPGPDFAPHSREKTLLNSIVRLVRPRLRNS